jgi:hypothetical protein
MNPDRRTTTVYSFDQSATAADIERPSDHFLLRQGFGPAAALRRSYRSRRPRRPSNSPYGTAVLALALELEGFLTVFDPLVTRRTPSPRVQGLHFINQGLTNC